MNFHFAGLCKPLRLRQGCCIFWGVAGSSTTHGRRLIGHVFRSRSSGLSLGFHAMCGCIACPFRWVSVPLMMSDARGRCFVAMLGSWERCSLAGEARDGKGHDLSPTAAVDVPAAGSREAHGLYTGTQGRSDISTFGAVGFMWDVRCVPGAAQVVALGQNTRTIMITSLLAGDWLLTATAAA